MAVVFLVLGTVYLVTKRNEAFYSDHKYPRDDPDYVQARSFRSKCGVALWGSECALTIVLAAMTFHPLTTLTITTLAVVLSVLNLYRHWPNLRSEA